LKRHEVPPHTKNTINFDVTCLYEKLGIYISKEFRVLITPLYSKRNNEVQEVKSLSFLRVRVS